ncbi:MAG: hypothetical protein KJ018_10945 [Burkholderiales bacterium]|nr:hypothetical protein [Burkholderiales bacterium]GIK87539.1 MAG: hypothetical protein BroJett026_30200 [Betaproteobacteria bacterium]
MRVRARCGTTLPAIAALALAGCAAPPAPDLPREVRAKALPPYQVHEECLAMAEGEAIDWRFASSAPVHFNIHYHEGKVVIMPVTLDDVRSERGTFVALTAQDYCLAWEAGARAASIDYAIERGRGR